MYYSVTRLYINIWSITTYKGTLMVISIIYEYSRCVPHVTWQATVHGVTKESDRLSDSMATPHVTGLC